MSHGRPISKDVADKEITKFKSLTEPVSETIVRVLSVFGSDKERLAFYSSTSNAFLFEKSTIERFFGDKGDGNSGDCENLLVIFGAHHVSEDGTTIGTPTVILAGVNKVNTNPEDQTYKTLDIQDPATEYPTASAVVELPISSSSPGFRVKIL